MQSGSVLVHGAWYYVPLIGWYTGMRRELENIGVDDGRWQFIVQPTEIRRLRTTTSVRKLPFASELVRLGLPDYVTALTDEGFPRALAASPTSATLRMPSDYRMKKSIFSSCITGQATPKWRFLTGAAARHFAQERQDCPKTFRRRSTQTQSFPIINDNVCFRRLM